MAVATVAGMAGAMEVAARAAVGKVAGTVVAKVVVGRGGEMWAVADRAVVASGTPGTMERVVKAAAAVVAAAAVQVVAVQAVVAAVTVAAVKVVVAAVKVAAVKVVVGQVAAVRVVAVRVVQPEGEVVERPGTCPLHWHRAAQKRQRCPQPPHRRTYESWRGRLWVQTRRMCARSHRTHPPRGRCVVQRRRGFPPPLRRQTCSHQREGLWRRMPGTCPLPHRKRRPCGQSRARK